MDTPLLVYSENQLDTDRFYRYQNPQEFFDGAAIGALGDGLHGRGVSLVLPFVSQASGEMPGA